MYKRILSVFLCILLVLTLIPASVFAAQGTGSAGFISSIQQQDLVPDGYTGIYSQTDLEKITANPSGLYILMEDIEVSNWIPICQSDNPFTGVFEGNGHTISGINITTEWERGDTMYLGLFSNIKDARIANLKVSGHISLTLVSSGGKLSGTICIGGIAAKAQGNVYIKNCISNVSMQVEGHSMAKTYGYGGCIGLYAGSSNLANISYCKNTATITGIYSTGGIIGEVDSNSSKLNVYGCQNESYIKGTLNVAGIIGYVDSSGAADSVNIAACWNKGEIYTTEQAGGIVGTIDSSYNTTTIEDCLNTGKVSTRNAPADAGGIVGDCEGNVYRCINTGLIYGAPTGSAIAGKIYSLNGIAFCYWLENSRSLVGLSKTESGMLTIRDGALSAEEMKKQEKYERLDFESVWEMSKELGHPVPNPIMNNTYKETYVSDTITFSNDSYRYKKIMAGSGKGSLAGVVGDTYEQSQSDFLNGLWEGIEFANAFANANVELTNEYDALLADMIYGSLGRDMVATHVNDSILGTYSDLTTYVSAEFGAIDTLLAETDLKELAKLGDVYDAKSKSILTSLRNTAVENLTIDNLGNAFSVLGGVVSMADIADASTKELSEMYDFYILCNAYDNAMDSYCDILADVADASYANEDGANLKGPLLRSAINNYTSQVRAYMSNDITAIYEKWGTHIGEIVQVGTGMIFDIAFDLSDFNPVLAGIKNGITFGVPLANSLTNMDSTAYYGKMLEMTAFLSKGLFDVVQERHDTFAHTQTYEDAEALNLAAEMYLNLQILACDYAIGYSNSIASAALSNALKLNYDDITATVLIQAYKADLLNLKKHGTQIYIGQDGSINGFIANCPVTVVVNKKDGTELACLETGQLTAKEGYHPYYQLLGANQEHKAGFYDSDEHTLTIIGEDEGTMDLVTYGTNEGCVSYICHFEAVPIEEGSSYTVKDTYLISDDGEIIQPDSTETFENPFTDIGIHWGKQYILNAYYDKLFSGYTTTTFAPDMPLTRGMFVTVLARYAGYDASQYTGTAFEDVPEEFYYAPAIKWAAQNGIVMGLTETSFGPDEKISRQDMATILYRYSNYAGLKLPEKISDVSFADQGQISNYAKDAVQKLCQAQIFSGNADNTFKPLNSATRAEAATVFCKLVDTFR